MKEVRCADVGLFESCEDVMRGETEDDVMAAAAAHGREVHGMMDSDFTDENVAKIRAQIREV